MNIIVKTKGISQDEAGWGLRDAEITGHLYIVLAVGPARGRESRARLLRDAKTTVEADGTGPQRLRERR